MAINYKRLGKVYSALTFLAGVSGIFSLAAGEYAMEVSKNYKLAATALGYSAGLLGFAAVGLAGLALASFKSHHDMKNGPIGRQPGPLDEFVDGATRYYGLEWLPDSSYEQNQK